MDQTDHRVTVPVEDDTIMPGFRFVPTEEELVGYYLPRLLARKTVPAGFIPTVDLYRHDPWELRAMSHTGEQQWLFFVPRHSKFRNGTRPTRLTKSGYWKTTGRDKLVLGVFDGSQFAAMKKTLVFYQGKATNGARTPWIMNEYRMEFPPHTSSDHQAEYFDCKELDSTLCKIYLKRPSAKRGGPRVCGGVATHRSASMETPA